MLIVTILLYVCSALLAIVGVVITLFSLPGVWLLFLAALLVASVGSFKVITPAILILIFIISVLSTFIDEIVVAIGAKKSGGSKYAQLGAVIGSVVGGLIGNIVGVFIGSFLGAFLFEYIFAKKDLNQSLKSGIGSFVGFILGIGLKTAVNIGIIIFVMSKLL